MPPARALSRAPEYGTLCGRGSLPESCERGFSLHMNRRVCPRGLSYAWLIPLIGLAYAPSVSAWNLIPDGLVIETSMMLAALLETENARPESAAEKADQARIEARRLATERRNASEMARMRKDLNDLEVSQGEIRSATIARRLTMLEELRNKDMITAAEYATKRREIMEGL